MKRSDTDTYERTILAATATKRRRRPAITPLVIFARMQSAPARDLPALREHALLAPPPARDCALAAPTRGVRIIDIA